MQKLKNNYGMVTDCRLFILKKMYWNDHIHSIYVWNINGTGQLITNWQVLNVRG